MTLLTVACRTRRRAPAPFVGAAIRRQSSARTPEGCAATVAREARLRRELLVQRPAAEEIHGLDGQVGMRTSGDEFGCSLLLPSHAADRLPRLLADLARLPESEAVEKWLSVRSPGTPGPLGLGGFTDRLLGPPPWRPPPSAAPLVTQLLRLATAPEITVAVIGDIDPDATREAVVDAMSSPEPPMSESEVATVLQGVEQWAPEPVPWSPAPPGTRLAIRTDGGKAEIRLGWRVGGDAGALGHRLLVQLLTDPLGPAARELRDRRGLVYRIRARGSRRADRRGVEVTTWSDPESAQEIRNRLLAVIRGLGDDGPQPADVQRTVAAVELYDAIWNQPFDASAWALTASLDTGPAVEPASALIEAARRILRRDPDLERWVGPGGP